MSFEHEVPEKLSVIFTVTPAFKAAIQLYAEKFGVSTSEFIRRAIAKEIEYDLDSDRVPRKRRTKYENDKERNIARLKAREARRKLKKALIDAYREQQRKKAQEEV